jgi:ABC-type transporter Mla maintaining outer membrane lipid asymmetry ATPase subunit MlaF
MLNTVVQRGQQAVRLHIKFESEFRGKANKEFEEGLDIYQHIYDPHVHFGRIIAILQSSGTGKSKLVKEIGNKVRFPF